MDRREFCRACGTTLTAAVLPGLLPTEEFKNGVLYPKRINGRDFAQVLVVRIRRQKHPAAQASARVALAARHVGEFFDRAGKARVLQAAFGAGPCRPHPPRPTHDRRGPGHPEGRLPGDRARRQRRPFPGVACRRCVEVGPSVRRRLQAEGIRPPLPVDPHRLGDFCRPAPPDAQAIQRPRRADRRRLERLGGRPALRRRSLRPGPPLQAVSRNPPGESPLVREPFHGLHGPQVLRALGHVLRGPRARVLSQVLGDELARPALDARKSAARLERRAGPRLHAADDDGLEPDRLWRRLVGLGQPRQSRPPRPGTRRRGLHQPAPPPAFTHRPPHSPLGPRKRNCPLDRPLGDRAA